MIVAVKRHFFRLPWMNPFLILFCAFLPIDIAKLILGPCYLLDKGIGDPYLAIAIFVTNISLFIKLMLTFIFLYLLNRSATFYFPPWFKGKYLSLLKLHFLEIFFFVASFVLFYCMAEASFGFLNWLNSPRTAYQYYRVGVGGLYALSLTLLSLAFAIGLVRQKKLFNIFIKSVIYLFFVYFWGSKGFLISFYIFFLIIVWFNNTKFLIPLLVLTVFPICLVLLYSLYTSVGILNLEKFSHYFNYFYNSAMYYETYFNGDIPLFNGKIFLTDFWSIVPRALYPEKPFVYGITHVNEIFYPGMAAKTHTPAFGGPVALFADFHILGVIVGSFCDFLYVGELYLTAVIFGVRRFDLIRNNSFLLIIFIIVFSPNLFWRIPLIFSAPAVVILFAFFSMMSLFVLTKKKADS